MTLEEAIEHAKEKSTGSDQCSKDHAQLTQWLEELLAFKKAYSCRCGALGRAPHTCPFAEEIAGDYETLCNCCDSCEEVCALDI